MDIYIGHSSSLDFKNVLYQPLRDCDLDENHNIVLPHENSDDPFNSENYLKNECDVFIAEVSEASTGLGIELGWADLYEMPIVCVHRENSEPSSSITEVTDEIKSYKNTNELINAIKRLIKENKD